MSEHHHNIFAAALERAWNEGSPVAGSTPETRQKIAKFALRRINSFSRRKVSEDSRADQVKDLAKGFISKFDENPKLVGRLKNDYQNIADAILKTHIELGKPQNNLNVGE